MQLQEEGLAVNEDNNEECCGACRSGGDLICCEGCPAAFHPECAGYCSADEVPEGDWLCWFCAKDTRKRYQHPKKQFKQQAGHAHVLLGTDDSAEVFVRVKLLNTTDKSVECSCLDVKAKPEVVPKTSHRLWHGTINKAAWTVDPDGIHWRPNCRVYKVDKAALAALQGKGPQQQQQQQPAAETPSSNTSPDAAATNGVPKGRSKLKLHFRGVKGTARSPRSQDQQQDQQQAQAGSLLGGPLPKGQTKRVKLSAPPSPSPPVANAAALQSPDGNPPGPPLPRGQDGEDVAAAAAAADDDDGGKSGGGAGTAAAEAGAGQDLSRVSDGEVAPRLPPIQGGADKQAFTVALRRFWSEHVCAPGERLPSTSIILGGVLVEPWAFWREVWAWGGPEQITKRKLWATIAHTFSPGAGSISTRASVYYTTALAPFDKAIDAGRVTLERPAQTRQPSDRWQMRSRSPSVGLKRPASQPNLLPTATSSQQLSGDEGAAAAAAASAGGAAGGSGRQRQRQGQGQHGARRQRPQQQAQRAKRRRVDQWSDNDEDDVILAGDVESTDESEDERVLGSSSDGGEGRQQDLWQRRRHQHRALAEANGRPGSTGSPKRLRVSVGKVKEGLVAGGLDSAGGYEYLRQPTDLVVLGKVTLAPAAQDIQVGDCVDFRQACSSGRCVTGWRSGVVLAAAPGSEWEGGRRLLIQPRHTTHHHHHHHHSHQLQGSTPSLTAPDSPAAAALAAVAAAGGPTGGSAAELAVHKLLTPGGHLRHELAGLLPARSGSIKPASAGDTAGTPPPPAAAAAGCSSQQQQENGPDAANEPQWMPMVWRGPWSQPFLAPPVLVRPHYTPTAHVVVPGAGASVAPAAAAGPPPAPKAAAAEDSIQSPFASPQQQQCGQGPGSHQQQQQQELRVGEYVEVLRDGCWCPAQVLELLPGGATGAAGVCVVLRSMAPPEADGSMWRCSGTHPMRPMHPRYTSGCGVVQCAGPEELVTVAAMRKAMAPYVYTENVHAFACMDHMRASAAAAQG